MTRQVPSLRYLAEISTLLLVHDQVYEQPMRAGQGVDDIAMRGSWDQIMELAREIHECAVPKKGIRGKKTKRPAAESIWPKDSAGSAEVEDTGPTEEK